MCLIGFALDAHPRYRLVLGANRDELHARATAPARFWRDQPRVLAGRDEAAGGTWLGVNTDGRVAAVTNFREGRPRDPEKRSRGELVSGFLGGDDNAATYARRVAARGDRYAGFSLLLFDRTAGWFVSNRDGEPHPVRPGIHALSNHLLDTPWPKVRRLRDALDETLQGERPDRARLSAALLDREAAARQELPDTGVGASVESLLSPPFVRSPEYGTRSSTVLTVPSNGRLHFEETTFDSEGCPRFSRRYRFSLGFT